MITFNMRSLLKPVSFKSVLTISAAIALIPASIGHAQSYNSNPAQPDSLSGVQPTYGLTQSLPDLSPDAIAAEVVSKFDPLTGRTEYTALDFDPFEQENRIAGTARLRSASSGITRDGASIAGGAYLDITVVYTSESRDSWDGKRLEHGVYMSGQPVDYMTYDIQSLDCQSDVTYVSYDDSYYRGASYGYVGGLYRPFPRYRGASRYYRECDRIRYGSWRGLRNNYIDYAGYDSRRNRNDRFRNEVRENIRERVTGERNNNYIDSARGERIDRDDVQERDLVRGVPGQGIVSSRNVIAPDQLGERRLDSRGDDLSNRPIASSRPRSSTFSRRVAPRSRDLEQIRESGAAAGVPRLSNAVPRLSTPRRAIPVRTPVITPPVRRSAPTERVRPLPRRGTRPVKEEAPRSETRRSEPRRTKPERRERPAVRTSRPTPPAASSQPTRTQRPSKPQTRSSERTAPKPSRSSRSNDRSNNRSSNRSSNRNKPSSTRSVNRSFGGSRSKPSPRTRRYYSGGSYTDRYEQTRCIKEERITLHIPEDRLLAARFDGLSIALLDQHGQDIPVYIPPNYVEGFIKANPYIGQYGATPSTYYPTTQTR